MLVSFFKRAAAFPWQSWTAVLIIVLQAAVLAVGQHVDDDDSFYVGAAAAAVETAVSYTHLVYLSQASGRQPRL